LTTSGERSAEEQVAARTLVTLRPLAGPLALGFLGLAAASFVLAGLQLGWVEPAEGKKVALLVLGFTVPVQLLASIVGFLARDPVAATGMGLLSGIWAATGLVLLTSAPGSTSDALGLFLLLSCIAMLAPATAALSSKLVPAVVLASAAVRFGLGGLHQLTGDETWENAAGVWGLWLAGVGVYAAYAVELEDALHRTVLPLGRHGKGATAVGGTYAQQVAELHKEPGVRQQL
jgi:succinate-acetate transporter protein